MGSFVQSDFQKPITRRSSLRLVVPLCVLQFGGKAKGGEENEGIKAGGVQPSVVQVVW
jgi:hypothetical protein